MKALLQTLTAAALAAVTLGLGEGPAMATSDDYMHCVDTENFGSAYQNRALMATKHITMPDIFFIEWIPQGSGYSCFARGQLLSDANNECGGTSITPRVYMVGFGEAHEGVLNSATGQKAGWVPLEITCGQ